VTVWVVEWDGWTSAITSEQRWVATERPDPYEGEGFVVGPGTRHSRANAVRLAAWLNEREGIT
jgi:hypothetical protein